MAHLACFEGFGTKWLSASHIIYLIILGNAVAWAVQRSRCRAILEFDASVPDA